MRDCVSLVTVEDLRQMGFESKPRPRPDISHLDLSGDNWKKSLPVTDDDIECAVGFAEQGKLQVHRRGHVGLQTRHPFGDDLMICAAYMAWRRRSNQPYDDKNIETMDILAAVIDQAIDKKFKHQDQARKIVWARLSDTYDKFEDLAGPFY